MTGTGTRRGATRRRLYEAAIALIAEQGFSATTVEQIAERAGVAKGTVYYNFASKAELFEELLRQGVVPLTVTLRRVAEVVLARGGGAVEALDAMAGAGLGFVSRHPALTRLVVAELWRPHRVWHATLVAARQQTAAVVADVLHEGVKTGELNDELEVEVTAGALVGMVVVTALDWQAFHPERPRAEVKAALSPLVRGLLAATPA
ncbi:TetR/AcrR family transcriptional regulator [Streptomyces sp. 4N509B]|uniref:TetR/AcrR family transcriptional regulator n=1 Tax=Streptomyces sp. 4N509B TaxID=3457413 RepID=UPI003FD08B4D